MAGSAAPGAESAGLNDDSAAADGGAMRGAVTADEGETGCVTAGRPSAVELAAGTETQILNITPMPVSA